MFAILNLILAAQLAPAETISSRVILASSANAVAIVEVTTPTTLEYAHCLIPAGIESIEHKLASAQALRQCAPLGPKVSNTPETLAAIDQQLTIELKRISDNLDRMTKPNPFSRLNLMVATGVGVGGTVVFRLIGINGGPINARDLKFFAMNALSGFIGANIGDYTLVPGAKRTIPTQNRVNEGDLLATDASPVRLIDLVADKPDEAYAAYLNFARALNRSVVKASR